MRDATAVQPVDADERFAGAVNQRIERIDGSDLETFDVPEAMLIMAWPIVTQPPIVPNVPDKMFATPCPTHSRLASPWGNFRATRVRHNTQDELTASQCTSPVLAVCTCSFTLCHLGAHRLVQQDLGHERLDQADNR